MGVENDRVWGSLAGMDGRFPTLASFLIEPLKHTFRRLRKIILNTKRRGSRTLGNSLHRYFHSLLWLGKGVSKSYLFPTQHWIHHRVTDFLDLTYGTLSRRNIKASRGICTRDESDEEARAFDSSKTCQRKLVAHMRYC